MGHNDIDAPPVTDARWGWVERDIRVRVWDVDKQKRMWRKERGVCLARFAICTTRLGNGRDWCGNSVVHIATGIGHCLGCSSQQASGIAINLDEELPPAPDDVNELTAWYVEHYAAIAGINAYFGLVRHTHGGGTLFGADVTIPDDARLPAECIPDTALNGKQVIGERDGTRYLADIVAAMMAKQERYRTAVVRVSPIAA